METLNRNAQKERLVAAMNRLYGLGKIPDGALKGHIARKHEIINVIARLHLRCMNGEDVSPQLIKVDRLADKIVEAHSQLVKAVQ